MDFPFAVPNRTEQIDFNQTPPSEILPFIHLD
jgi:hypothetical protein